MRHFHKTEFPDAIISLRNELIEAKLVRDWKEIISLEKPWQALEKQCPNTTLFQSFDWCQNYLKFADDIAKEQEEKLKPYVVSLWQGKALIGLLPLCIQKNNGLKVLTGLTEPFQQYSELLLSPKIEPSQIRTQLVDSLKSIKADYLHLGQVRLNGSLAKALEGFASQSGEKDAAPFVNLRQWPDFETYFKSIKSKTRKNMRNARNRLAGTAPIHHQIAVSDTQIAEVIARTFEGRGAWLEQLGITSRAFRNTNFELFLERFSNSKETGIDTLAMTLFHGDSSMADQWGFIYRGRYYAFMSTWNKSYEASSPGKLQLGEVIETCYDKGLEVADFMIPAVSYKRTWTDDASMVCDYVMPMSGRGFVQVKLWLGLLRPMAKKLVSILPMGIRSFLISKLLPSIE